MENRPISADDLDPGGCVNLIAAILYQACLDATAADPDFALVRPKKKNGQKRTEREIWKIEQERKREHLATVRLRRKARAYIYSCDSKHLAEQIGWNIWPPSEIDLAIFSQTRKTTRKY